MTKHNPCIQPWKIETHVRNTSYTIPSAAFHRTEVLPDVVHATLFYFDVHRGFFKDVAVLGPKDGESFTQDRDLVGVTPDALVHMVEALRSWEILMTRRKDGAQELGVGENFMITWLTQGPRWHICSYATRVKHFRNFAAMIRSCTAYHKQIASTPTS